MTRLIPTKNIESPLSAYVAPDICLAADICKRLSTRTMGLTWRTVAPECLHDTCTQTKVIELLRFSKKFIHGCKKFLLALA